MAQKYQNIPTNETYPFVAPLVCQYSNTCLKFSVLFLFSTAQPSVLVMYRWKIAMSFSLWTQTIHFLASSMSLCASGLLLLEPVYRLYVQSKPALSLLLVSPSTHSHTHTLECDVIFHCELIVSRAQFSHSQTVVGHCNATLSLWRL